MPAKPQPKPTSIKEPQPDHRLDDVIGRQVLVALGRPESLFQVQVRSLWDDRYRVNIFVGVDAASAKVAHSYFLVADGQGKILESTPKLQTCYA